MYCTVIKRGSFNRCLFVDIYIDAMWLSFFASRPTRVCFSALVCYHYSPIGWSRDWLNVTHAVFVVTSSDIECASKQVKTVIKILNKVSQPSWPSSRRSSLVFACSALFVSVLIIRIIYCLPRGNTVKPTSRSRTRGSFTRFNAWNTVYRFRAAGWCSHLRIIIVIACNSSLHRVIGQPAGMRFCGHCFCDNFIGTVE